MSTSLGWTKLLAIPLINHKVGIADSNPEKCPMDSHDVLVYGIVWFAEDEIEFTNKFINRPWFRNLIKKT